MKVWVQILFYCEKCLKKKSITLKVNSSCLETSRGHKLILNKDEFLKTQIKTVNKDFGSFWRKKMSYYISKHKFLIAECFWRDRPWVISSCWFNFSGRMILYGRLWNFWLWSIKGHPWLWSMMGCNYIIILLYY